VGCAAGMTKRALKLPPRLTAAFEDRQNLLIQAKKPSRILARLGQKRSRAVALQQLDVYKDGLVGLICDEIRMQDFCRDISICLLAIALLYGACLRRRFHTEFLSSSEREISNSYVGLGLRPIAPRVAANCRNISRLPHTAPATRSLWPPTI